MKKWILWLGALVVLVLVALIWIPVSFPMKKSIAAVAIKHNDPTYLASLEIVIDGQYNYYLYKRDEFYGKFAIEGMEGTNKSDTLPYLWIDETWPVPLAYQTDDFRIYQFGSVISDQFLNHLFIGVSDAGSWDGADGTSIFAPAGTRLEAKQTWEQLSKKSEWLSAVAWED